jgi:hypothetical protein
MNDSIVPYLAITIGVLGWFVTVWLRPVMQRRLQQKNEIRYLREEFRDLARHINLNIGVMDLIEKSGSLPLEMHIAKLKIPKDSAVFSIDTLKLADPRIASRLYEMRLKMRNLNLEIDDLMQLSRCGEISTFFELLRYHRQKCQRAVEVLNEERSVLAKSKAKGRQKSLVIAKIIPRPMDSNSRQKPADGTVDLGIVKQSEDTSLGYVDTGSVDAIKILRANKEPRSQSTEND